jgi:hypothetical protein
MRDLENTIQNAHVSQAYPMWVGNKRSQIEVYNLQSYLEAEAKQGTQT